MKGCARAATRDYETLVSQAWHGEMFAREKKLKALAKYLPSDGDEQAPVQPEVVLDAMLTMQAHGVPMEIKKVG